MGVQEQLDRLKSDIDIAYAAVREKGGEVPEEGGSVNLAAAIAAIPQGVGGPVQWEDINGRPDLSNVSKLDRAKVTISAYLWDENGEATVLIPDLPSEDTPGLIIPVPTSDSENVYYGCDIMLVGQAEGILTFKAETIPEQDVGVYIYLNSAAEVGEEYVGEFVWWSPQMTANNAPAPYRCSASGFDPYYPDWQAFDNNTGSFWINGPSSTQWIMFDFGKPVTVFGIRLYPRFNMATETPKTGVIQGSNDGTEWYDIYSFSNLPQIAAGTWREFLFKKLANYRYYRIAYMESDYANYVAIAEIEFYLRKG